MPRLFSSLLLSLSIASSGSAVTDVRIDLSSLIGTTAGNWNNVSNLTGMTSNLIDFHTGADTGVSIDGTGSPWHDFFGDGLGYIPNQDWLEYPAAFDGAGLLDDTTGTFVLGGLAGSAYQIELVSARAFEYLNTFTVNGALADRTFLGTAVVTPWNSNTDALVNGSGNWLIWNSVVPAGGAITLVDVSGPGTLGILNAVRILEVPEPGTGVLVIAGLLGLASWRRGPA